jgi:hypothetical protein
MAVARQDHTSIPLTFSFKYLIFAPYSSGKQYPVSGILRTVAPDLMLSHRLELENHQFYLHLQHKIQHLQHRI